MNQNILDFGARPELENNAPAINAAIESCSSTGGGVVTVPQGRYVTGTLYLKDNVELHLEQGATLKASCDPDAYNSLDAYPQNYEVPAEGWDSKHLIIAAGVTNVAITGYGKIEGAAEHWFGAPTFGNKFGWRFGFRNTKDRDKGKLRPGQLIVFVESSHIRVADVTITESTSWCCFFHGCDFVQVRGIKVFNGIDHANTDGLDIDSCRYVTVSDCIIDTGDDCIAIRGAAQRLLDKSRLCEYVTITNCVLACSADAFRVGVGTGRIQHVRVSNIVIHRAGNAIDFNTSYCGHGHCELDDINFAGISATGTARAMRLETTDVPVSRVTIENFRCECMASSFVKADKLGALTDVTLRGIDIFVKPFHCELDENLRRARGEYALDCSQVEGLRLEDVRVFFDEGLRELWSGEIRTQDVI